MGSKPELFSLTSPSKGTKSEEVLLYGVLKILISDGARKVFYEKAR